MAKKSKPVTISLNIHNIGPFSELNFSESISKLQIAVFAPNGTGKTFLSRAFNLFSKNPNEINYSDLLKIGSIEGAVSFCITNNNENGTRKAEARVINTSAPIITNSSGYLFHIFNSDYVKQNLESNGYKPDSEINGYIMGKGNIDVKAEKQKKQQIEKNITDLNQNINALINDGINGLDGLSINKRTSEYIAINFNNLYNNTSIKEARSWSEVVENYKTINSLPDDYPDIQNLLFTLDASQFAFIEDFLKSEFTRSKLSLEFKNMVQSNFSFINSGLQLLRQEHVTICPFCGQTFSQEALDLIDKYNEFLNDSEGKIISQIDGYKSQVKQFAANVDQLVTKILKIKSEYEKLQKFIPSAKNSVFETIDDSVRDSTDEIIKILDSKARNIEEKLSLDSQVSLIKSAAKNIEDIVRKNNMLIDKLNEIKNNLSKEKLSIRKELCNAKYNEIINVTAPLFSELKKNENDLQSINTEIESKEASIKIEKKKIVTKTFMEYLSYFFSDKYLFDENTFMITFLGTGIDVNTPKILSDGEKTVVAFCYYLAETHTIVDTDVNYKSLFFIIDDPISSMDFHYVYYVAEILRSLNLKFNMERNRFILFTHNMEFMSILMRNKVTSANYFITNGSIKTIKESMVMPYEQHLKDVYEVAKGVSAPSYHTPNSIRHIIETICNFESPGSAVSTFFKNNDELKKNDFIFSLINDCSHGIIRNQKAYTDDMVVIGCKALIDYINKHYKGQLSRMEANQCQKKGL